MASSSGNDLNSIALLPASHRVSLRSSRLRPTPTPATLLRQLRSSNAGADTDDSTPAICPTPAPATLLRRLRSSNAGADTDDSTPAISTISGFLFIYGNATMNHTQSFNLVDPFEEQSILSLNPRTFGVSKEALKSIDLEAIHQYMKSMALQNPDKLFEEAKSVIDGGSKFLNTKESEANIKEKENIRERRPGLIRRRAKFSMKPDTSQPSTFVEPTLELDHLQSPEEFFAAFEKFENTKKELRRQRGEVDEVKTARHRIRRPEIPRRKVSYRHYEYTSQSQDDTSVVKETLQDNTGNPQSQDDTSVVKETLQDNTGSPPIILNQQYEEDEVAGSIAKSENKVDKLFDELMASNIDKLDENEALNFLKDRLKIKPVDISDLQLPEFHEIPRVDFISPVKNLLEGSQSILSVTNDLPDVTKGKTLGSQRKLSDKPFQSLGSPTPPKSPFLAISNFGKRMLKSIVSKDPFSTHDVDLSPSTTSTNIIGGGSSHASKDKEVLVSATLDSLAMNEITETAIGDVEDRDHNMEEREVDDNVTDIQTNEDINENAEDMVQEAASVTEVNLNVEDIIVENVEDVREKEGPEVDVEDIIVENVSSVDNLDMDITEPAPILDDVPQQQKEEEHPRKKTNQGKKITRKLDLKKKRQSLAGDGSSWTSGVRRSSRIKRRPLEYWKGERLLYGRVHNSLPTVIGVKYISPSKAGFKVESFVSEKYKELVELTALH
ncbi:hypothetical protein L1887_19945 [Cichorium endivia]|nr:hypothetical protein L1887_19945 [Cichorium endivia]